jgi:aminopeptidase N
MVQIDYMKQARVQAEEQGSGSFSASLPVFAYGDNTVYSAWVYDRTAAILQELKAEIGETAFFDGLKRYYTFNRLDIATRDDLIGAFEAASGRSLTKWFDERIGKAE